MRGSTAVFLFVGITFVPTIALSENGGFVLVNSNNSYPSNSVSGFKVAANGTMQFLNSLSTGTPGYLLEPLTAQTIAVESDAHCLFAADSENSDSAIFAGPKFQQQKFQQLRPSFTAIHN